MGEFFSRCENAMFWIGYIANQIDENTKKSRKRRRSCFSENKTTPKRRRVKSTEKKPAPKRRRTNSTENNTTSTISGVYSTNNKPTSIFSRIFSAQHKPTSTTQYEATSSARRSNSTTTVRRVSTTKNTPTSTIRRVNSEENTKDLRDYILNSQEQTINKQKEEIDKLKRKLKIEKLKNLSFSSRNKNNLIEISGNGKRVTCIGNSVTTPHCYINLKIEEGIHHLVFFMSYFVRPFFAFGATTNDNYSGENLNKDYTSCSITIWDEHSILLGGNGNEIIHQSFNSITAKNNKKYELIIDMVCKVVSLKQENCETLYLFRNIHGPLYPFVCLMNKGNTIEIVDYWED